MLDKIGYYRDTKYLVFYNEKLGTRCGYIQCHPVDKFDINECFDIHGGITREGPLNGFEGYWIGFDCAHYGDAPDWRFTKPNAFYEFESDGSEMIIWTREMVENECKRTIDFLLDTKDCESI